MTTRGLGIEDFKEIANIIADRLLSPEDSNVEANCRNRVAALCNRFPLYPHLHPTEAVLA